VQLAPKSAKSNWAENRTGTTARRANACRTTPALQPLLDILKQIDDAGLPKPESPGQVYARAAGYSGIYPLPNLAVSICEKSFTDATTQAMQEEKSDKIIRLAGKLAYCTVMPKLSGAANIRDFIACVTYAIIPGPEGTRLLYGAQVAHTALTKRPNKRGKSSHTSTTAVEPTKLKSTT
jgi:hypothetical protein